MTKEEAIELIHDIQTDAVYSILPEEKEALDMAISALSEKEWKFYYDHGYAQAKRDLSENKGRTYGEVINFYLNSLVETYKRMGYTITEISITEKNSLSPTIYEFEEKGGE